MKTPDYIDKIAPDRDGLDFDALRKSGIAMLQELCGENWTDYNLHDPGVTILEQLCYGLTDLAYRSEFAAEDYLAGAAGQIDFERHALHAADQVFPSGALTQDDYRKIIYDEISEIEDIWVMPAEPAQGPRQGLYTMLVKLSDSAFADLSDAALAALEQRVRQAVCAVFIAHRNLGEDIHDVQIVRTEAFFLRGDIQIHSLRDPAAILADIFFRCARQVISGFRVDRYEDMVAQGMSLEQLFSGPQTAHGYLANSVFSEAGNDIPVVKLISLIQAVDGVEHVHRLGLCDQDGKSVAGVAASGSVPRLQFPATPQQSLFLRLHFASSAGGRQASVDAHDDELHVEKAQIVLDDARMELKKRQFEFNAVRNSRQSLEQVIPAPAGVRRPLHDYYSIQHQFPAIYGINQYGVPASAPLKSKVSARQLKAYLFLSEQLMANYLQNLEEIPRIFSIDSLQQSYYSQVLDNRALPDIEALYVRPMAQIGNLLAATVGKYDKLEDRRSRVIDVLLAMFGEEFSQKSLRRFNYYEERHSGQWMIDNKLAFLRHIVALSRDRASGFNYREKSWGSENVASVQAKCHILLGLKAHPLLRSLSQELVRHNIRLVPDAADGAASYESAGRYLLQGPAAAPGGAWQNVPAPLFTKGVNLENFVLESAGDSVVVNFQPYGRAKKVSLDRYRDAGEAELQVQKLQQSICRLNVASEGFHIVEHILLRPRGKGADAGQPQHAARTVPDDFYGFRISVVFPSWTARFSDPDFRNLAQETLCRNLPAHIYPEFHWLDFLPMRDFEERHRIWLERLQQGAASGFAGNSREALDTAARSLANFLLRHRQADDAQDHWV
jgi:hypothetical protein